MPLPQKHLDELEVDLDNHYKELQALQAGPPGNQSNIQTQIEFHKIILQVGRDHKVRALLGEIHDNQELIDQLASDPEGFLRSRGIHLPAGASKVEAIEFVKPPSSKLFPTHAR